MYRKKIFKLVFPQEKESFKKEISHSAVQNSVVFFSIINQQCKENLKLTIKTYIGTFPTEALSDCPCFFGLALFLARFFFFFFVILSTMFVYIWSKPLFVYR